MTEPFYVAVKASLHASDSSVFGLTPEEVNALSKRYDSNREVINGVLIKASPLKVINSLSELGYRVICSSGEAEIVWTLRREILDENSTEIECNLITTENVRDIEAHERIKALIEKEETAECDDATNKELVHKLSSGHCEEITNKHEVQNRLEKKEVERIGIKPDDFAAFSDYKGPKIVVRNPSSLDNLEEGTAVIVNTNTASPQNPLVGSYNFFATQYFDEDMSGMDPCQCNHSAYPCSTSVHQTLDEMDFERGIWTPAMTGDIDKVRDHLKKGTSPDAEDNAGYTALHYAARCGYTHVCAILLEAGASVNKITKAGGATALHRAAMSGHPDVCRLLMCYGANPLAKDVDGRTPLHRAVEGGHQTVIIQIIESVPSAAFEKDNQGKTPLDYAEQKGSLSGLFVDVSKKKSN